MSYIVAMNILLSAINSRHTHCAIALAYIKAYWEHWFDSGPELRISEYDLNQTRETIISDLILKKPDVLAFSVYIWSLESILSICSAVKAALPDCKIILGGPEVSYTAKNILIQSPFLDYIVRKEGEKTFSLLLQTILNSENATSIPGITFRNNHAIIHNPDAVLIQDLDSIPSPFQLGLLSKGKSFTYYEASRGCSSKCDYCLSSVQGPVRYHSIERVKNDLDWFFNSEFRQVRFADRTFNSNPERAIQIIDYILENNKKKINFHFEIQADFLSDRIIQKLAKGHKGMFHLEIGIQSTNPTALKAVNRNFNLSKLETAIKKLRNETDCDLHLDLLGGLPEENFTSFCTSLDQIWSLDPQSIQISLVKVLRGTPLEKQVERGMLFPMSAPPYTVLRTKWLDADEAVKIADIGKLIEGMHNCNRFNISIFRIVELFYENKPSIFFCKLAEYFRENKLLFYNFSPEKIFRVLTEFIKSTTDNQKNCEIVQTLLEHELHLCQKVPAPISKFGPDLQTGKISRKLKVVPGLKSFWYKYKLDEVLAFEKNPLPGCFPTVYKFEKDLSKKPDTRYLDLELSEHFIIACLHRKIKISVLESIWKNLIPDFYTKPDFNATIERLVEKGLLYDPVKSNYNQVKKLIARPQPHK